MSRPAPVLVLGATGDQGGAVIRALIDADLPVRALVRDPTASTAQSLAARGVELALGDFDDETSLIKACDGARSVFSLQNAPLAEPHSERRHGAKIIAAAKASGVPQMIHSSVSGAGSFEQWKDWGTGRWDENYWQSKADVEAAVRDAGFASSTILRPAFLMENFLMPKAAYMFPDLVEDAIVTALFPETRMVLVAADDIGAAALAAVSNPTRFDHATIELAGDALTMGEVASVLSHGTGRSIAATSLSPDDVLARGQYGAWVTSQEWSNQTPYPATPADALVHGLQTTTMAQWAQRYASRFPQASGSPG